MRQESTPIYTTTHFEAELLRYYGFDEYTWSLLQLSAQPLASLDFPMTTMRYNVRDIRGIEGE